MNTIKKTIKIAKFKKLSRATYYKSCVCIISEIKKKIIEDTKSADVSKRKDKMCRNILIDRKSMTNKYIIKVTEHKHDRQTL